MIWMLTKDDGTPDGGKIEYLKGAGDRGHFRFLKASLKGKRQVSRLNEYFENHYPKDPDREFEYHSYGENIDFTNSGREAYFAGVKEEDLQSAVVFLDPDNGLVVKSANKNNLHKYVNFEEIKSVFKKMSLDSCLVIYQHLPHSHRHLFFYGLYRDLIEELDCPTPVSITDN